MFAILFAIFLWSLVKCLVDRTQGESTVGDVDESAPCCFLSQFVGLFVARDPRVCFDPRERYLPVLFLQGSYCLSNFLYQICVVPGILQRVKCDSGIRIYLSCAQVFFWDVRCCNGSERFYYGNLISLVIRAFAVQSGLICVAILFPFYITVPEPTPSLLLLPSV